MSQKLLVNGFKWVEDFSESDESFIKNYEGKKLRRIFSKTICHFCRKK